MTKTKLLLFCILSLGTMKIKAQNAVTSSGGEATGSGGSVSYSVGQAFYTTNTGTNGSVGQGVQQPYEISIVIGINEAKGIELECSAYPNPASDFLILKVENNESSTMNLQLYDMNGKLLESKKITGNQANISMSDLPVATYSLKVSDNNIELKSFKIIKN